MNSESNNTIYWLKSSSRRVAKTDDLKAQDELSASETDLDKNKLKLHNTLQRLSCIEAIPR